MTTNRRGTLNVDSCRRFIVLLLLTACLSAPPDNAGAESGDAASIITAIPYFAEAEQRGYRLYATSDPVRFRALGLRSGDLLLEINGLPMVKPQMDLHLFARLDDGESVVAKIRRAGDLVEVTLKIP